MVPVFSYEFSTCFPTQNVGFPSHVDAGVNSDSTSRQGLVAAIQRSHLLSAASQLLLRTSEAGAGRG